jgi:hypothetical protein
MQSPPHTNTLNHLETFLQQPNIENSPAWEFIQGKAQQKPMSTLFHSRLQQTSCKFKKVPLFKGDLAIILFVKTLIKPPPNKISHHEQPTLIQLIRG